MAAAKKSPARGGKKVVLNKTPETKKARTPAAAAAKKRAATKKVRKPSTQTKAEDTAKEAESTSKTPAKKTATKRAAARKAPVKKATAKKTTARKAPAKKAEPDTSKGFKGLPSYLAEDGKLHRGWLMQYVNVHEDPKNAKVTTVTACSKVCFNIAAQALETLGYEDDDIRFGRISIYRDECSVHPVAFDNTWPDEDPAKESA